MSTAEFTVPARVGRGIVLVLTAGALAVGASGCGQARGGNGEGGPPPTGSGALGSGGTPPTAEAAGQPGDGTADGGGNGSGTGTSAGTGNSSGTGNGAGTGSGHDGGAAEPAGPRIAYFRIKRKPTCPGGTNLHPVPGRPLVIEWKVTGADRVELAVDGPGLYNTYAPQGSETFTFSCGGPPGTVEKHTYRLSTAGGGNPKWKSISASATVNEIPVVDDPTAAPAQ